MDAIRIGTKRFVPRRSADGDGVYRRLKGGILFCRLDGTPVAFLVAHTPGERFFVSASRHSGRLRYAFGLSSDGEKFLGLPHSYAAQSAVAHLIAGMHA